jgi:glutathione peroxidase
MSTAVTEIPVRTMSGKEITLGEFKGKVALVVNVASKCGLTPQYQGLETLYKNYRDKGFVVLGFPANDFGRQEPGTNEEIQSFCSTNFGVDFPMFEKIAVLGEGKHPLYKALTAAQPHATAANPEEYREHLKSFGQGATEEPEVLWNFEKFLLNRKGEVVARFSPETKPESPLITKAVEAELAK